MIRTITVLFLWLSLAGVYAQDKDNSIYQSIDFKLDYEEGFEVSIPLIKKKMEKNKDNASLNYQLGFCYLHSDFYKQHAIVPLHKAYKSYTKRNNEIDSSAITAYYLARAYHYNHEFDKAIATYNEASTLAKGQEPFIYEVDKQIERCNTGIAIMQQPTEVSVRNAGKTINSKFDDIGPVFSANERTLFFTSRRKGSRGSQSISYGQYFQDIYVSEFIQNSWQMPISVSNNINTESNEAVLAIAADAQEMILMRDGNFYCSKRIGNEWSVALKMPETINSKYEEKYASLSADGTTLYFTSNRAGGYGGFDIYIAKKNKKGQWSDVVNAGAVINTAEDEATPAIHHDGQTLYFSSEGHRSMGDFDIFKTKRTASGWSKPQNMGYPLNTTGDDLHFMPTADGRRAYFSSTREGGLGRSDIYTVLFSNGKESNLTLFSGYLTNYKGEPIKDAKITVSDLISGEVLNTYRPNAASGQFLFVLTVDRDYNFLFEAEGHLFRSENLSILEVSFYNEIEKNIALKPVSEGNTIEAYPIAYYEKEAELNDDNTLTVNAIARCLERNETAYIDISGSQSEMYSGINEKRIAIVAELMEKNRVGGDRIFTDLTTFDIEGNNIVITIFDKSTLQALIRAKEENTFVRDIAESDRKNNFINKIIKSSSTSIAALKEVEQIKKSENTEEELLSKGEIVPIEDNVEHEVEVKIKRKTYELLKFNIHIVENVHFEANKYSLDADNKNLNLLADYLKNNPKAKIEVGGYADMQGGLQYNIAIAKKRADFVAAYLQKKGAKKSQLVVKNYGVDDPIANIYRADKSYNRNALTYNRRVEIKLLESDKDSLLVKQIVVPKKLQISEKFKNVVNDSTLSQRVHNMKNALSAVHELPYEYVSANIISLNATKENTATIDKEEIFYHSIVLKVSPTKLNLNDFNDLPGVQEKTNAKGSYYYIYGKFITEEQAEAEANKIKSSYPNAYIFIDDLFNK